MNKLNLSNLERLAISGIHGWGKTTLAKRISSLTGLRYLPEVARELLDFAKDFRWDVCSDYKLITDFEKAIYHSHLFLLNTNQSFVSDRTLVDVLVYVEYHLSRSKSDSLKSFKEEILRELQSSDMLYDAVLYASPLEGYKTSFGGVDKKIIRLFEESKELFFRVARSVFVIKRGTVLEFSEGELIV